jgi:hypothetical protein
MQVSLRWGDLVPLCGPMTAAEKRVLTFSQAKDFRLHGFVLRGAWIRAAPVLNLADIVHPIRGATPGGLITPTETPIRSSSGRGMARKL